MTLMNYNKSSFYIGEGYAGEKNNAAHINILIGSKEGPLGFAFSNALSSPSQGHVPFLVVASPGVPVKPYTLFVNKATLQGPQHEKLTWGAAQAGVAKAILEWAEQLLQGKDINDPAFDDLVAIVAVWVDPMASDEQKVFENNYAACRDAINRAINNAQTINK